MSRDTEFNGEPLEPRKCPHCQHTGGGDRGGECVRSDCECGYWHRAKPPAGDDTPQTPWGRHLKESGSVYHVHDEACKQEFGFKRSPDETLTSGDSPKLAASPAVQPNTQSELFNAAELLKPFGENQYGAIKPVPDWTNVAWSFELRRLEEYIQALLLQAKAEGARERELAVWQWLATYLDGRPNLTLKAVRNVVGYQLKQLTGGTPE